jgi:hypothetical protein
MLAPYAEREHPDVAACDRREEVLSHVEEILRSPLFGNSKRYCSLLRYIVEQTLDGRADLLKERTIGVEAFGRPADYDTNVDHSVRSSAGEVRRRLALYYAEFGADSGIRIELQSGSYVPQIRFLNVPMRLAAAEAVVESEPAAAPSESAHTFVRRAMRWKLQRMALLAALAVFLIGGISLRSTLQPRDPFDEFWGPILSSPNQALLCVGGGRQPAPVEGQAPTISEFEHTGPRRMNVADAMALVSVTNALQSKKKPFRILNRASSTSFKDLQEGPFILIGAMNNEWTLRLTSGLRFGFDHVTNGARVTDRQNPSNVSWTLDFTTRIDQKVRDYGIITRLHDPMTDQAGLIVAGIGSWGTQAAAEFVSSSANLRKLASLGPQDWSRKNIQVVIGTDVIRGSSGPPIVLGSWFW